MRVSTLIAAFLSAVALAACGGEDAAEDAATTAEQEATQAAGGESTPAAEGDAAAIDVALSEWKVDPAKASAQAGTVVFNAVNEGQAPHELEVIDTDTPAGDFPVEDSRAQIDGKEVGEVTGIAAGRSKVLQVDLEPGHYALICNLPGHYQPGMYADFEVK
jgi:uncharacterized cupredoxin-like copper-binding protein